MKVHQFLTSYSYGDAIGNEALEIRDFLRANGIESEIFTLHFHPRYAHQVRNYLEYDRFSDPANTVIFHFSIGSPVTKKFLRLADKADVLIAATATPVRSSHRASRKPPNNVASMIQFRFCLSCFMYCSFRVRPLWAANPQTSARAS